MREALDRLLRDLTLTTLALAIALGWALYQFAAGISDLVATLLVEYPDTGGGSLDLPLTWQIGGRVLTFHQLLRGSIDLVVVLAVAAFVYHRRATARNSAKPS